LKQIAGQISKQAGTKQETANSSMPRAIEKEFTSLTESIALDEVKTQI